MLALLGQTMGLSGAAGLQQNFRLSASVRVISTTRYTPPLCSKRHPLTVAEGDPRPRALGSSGGHGDLLFLYLIHLTLDLLPGSLRSVITFSCNPGPPVSILPL